MDVDESEKLRAELAAVEEAPTGWVNQPASFLAIINQVVVNQMELIKYHYLVNLS